ncbi:HAD family phosphatase [Streptomyces sp. UNOC14_S4]|uniref:HAD family hydrolase n=1 Tax=Streptomyces sp. UNOC14_S4 TaxID=2872340 RepID=UPI001E374717|nr:HAD family phosphatase [Streptomyces sp. UNOC14_S4]MCC3767659.1 HAD family phosphatase [Streptomyces sp. UNOC14_S4]
MPRLGLILDFGGVLTTPVPDCARSFARHEGLPEDAFLHAFAVDPAGKALYADLERGKITQAEWNTAMGALLGLADAENLLGRVLRDLHPEPRMIRAAQSARRAGVKVGILSNSLGSAPCDPYDGYDLETLYDAVLISEKYRMRKPDAEIYTIMLDLMGLPARECVFVDDTARNLPPAEKLGMATVLATTSAATIAQVEALLGLPVGGRV